jgi:dipeptidyl aminopeptidase/acylaminoacyl peptidase
MELHPLFPLTFEFAETHRLPAQVEERFSLDLEMSSDVPVAWSPLRPSLLRARPSALLRLPTPPIAVSLPVIPFPCFLAPCLSYPWSLPYHFSMPLFHRALGCLAVSCALCASSNALAQSAAAPAQSSAPAASRLDEVLAHQSRAHFVSQVAVSPDGKRVAWLQAGQLHVAPYASLAQSLAVTAAPSGQVCNASQFVWSPGSAAIAFLSDCANPGEQSDLYLSHLDSSPARRISNLRGYVYSPAFSPDGKSIAFLYVEGSSRPPGALAAETPPSGVIGEDHVDVERVALVPAGVTEPAAPAFATPSNLNVYEFDWSPDSKSLACIAADPPGQDNWWVAKLYTQPVDAGTLTSALSVDAPSSPAPAPAGDRQNSLPTPTAILAPADVSGPLHGLQIAVPRWSPDGKSIAFIGGLMSDQGVVGGDVWIVPSTGGQPAAGGQPVDLTPGRPSSAIWIAWDDSSSIFVSELSGGDSRLVRLKIPASAGAPAAFNSPVFSIPASVGAGGSEGSLSATADRSIFVFQASSFSTPPEIFSAWGKVPESVHSADIARIGQLSHFNDGVEPSWGKSVSLTWKNGGFDVQGWLLLPAHYDPAKKYPLLVEVHGGPSSSVVSRWSGGAGGFSATTFSSLGYFVLLPNPRGSYGQGEAFTQANRKDFGYGDLQDILAGVDTVLAKYSADSNRVGISGWSYGGFMAMFAVTQTHRFRAAVAGAGISNWLSYYGENSIDQWMIPFFGASVYDDPQVYARSSAINFIRNVATPTLTVVGDRDGECPAPQSFEFWHALRDLHVPTELVVYSNEGHGLSNPADRRDVLRRAVDWFARYMPPTSSAP